MGLFDALWLDAVWFYDRPIDVEALKSTLEGLVTRCPALAGRAAPQGIVLSNEGMRLSFSFCCERSSRAYSEYVGADAHTEAERHELALVGDDLASLIPSSRATIDSATQIATRTRSTFVRVSLCIARHFGEITCWLVAVYL